MSERKKKFEIAIEDGTGLPLSELPLPKNARGQINIKLLVDLMLKQLDTTQSIDLLLELLERFDYPDYGQLLFYNTLSCYDHDQAKTRLKLNLEESTARGRLYRLKKKLGTDKKATRDRGGNS